MTEGNPAAASLDDLIARYERARDDRNRVRFIITAIIMVIVIAYILLGYLEVKNFAEERAPEFGVALAREASAMAPVIVEDLNDSVNALIPAFEKTFNQAIEKNHERMVDVLLSEYHGLQQYSQEKWPEIENALAEMVIAQEENARICLSQHVPPEKLAGLGVTYKQALTDYMADFFQKRFGQDMLVAEEIVAKLQLVSESEPNMAPADTQFILGMIVELLGMQMQIHRAGPEALTE